MKERLDTNAVICVREMGARQPLKCQEDMVATARALEPVSLPER